MSDIKKDPEIVEAIKVMAQTPVYFQGGHIDFSPNGDVAIYLGESMAAETRIEDEKADVKALEIWRSLNLITKDELEAAMADLKLELKNDMFSENDLSDIFHEALFDLNFANYQE